jgi:hypothetical protein
MYCNICEKDTDPKEPRDVYWFCSVCGHAYLHEHVHVLKTIPEYYNSIIDGTKTFEVRKNDRDFLVGDTLFLREYDPETNKYTGRLSLWTIRYILNLSTITDCNSNYVVMSIKRWRADK